MVDKPQHELENWYNDVKVTNENNINFIIGDFNAEPDKGSGLHYSRKWSGKMDWQCDKIRWTLQNYGYKNLLQITTKEIMHLGRPPTYILKYDPESVMLRIRLEFKAQKEINRNSRPDMEVLRPDTD